MCHNKETSFVIFIFAVAAFIKLIKQYYETKDEKYRSAAFYLFGLAGMQLVEFFIHYSGFKGKHTTNKNQFLSWMVLLAIIVQFIIAEVYIYSNEIFPKQVAVLDVLFYVCIFILSALVYMNKDVLTNGIDCSHKKLWFGCKMNWGIMNTMMKRNLALMSIAMLLYVVYIFVATYHIFNEWIFAVFVFIYFMTMVAPALYQVFMTGSIWNLPNGSSSAWCFFVIILTVIIVIFDNDSIIKDSKNK